MKRFLKKWAIISTYVVAVLMTFGIVPISVWGVFSFVAISPNPVDWHWVGRAALGAVSVVWWAVCLFAFEDGNVLSEWKSQYHKLMGNTDES